jgi:MFS family permease
MRVSAQQGTMFRALSFRDFRLVWSAQVLSELGDWSARVALAILVLDKTGSKVLTAAVTAVGFLPWVGVGQALAALGDRIPRRSVMVAADVVRAAAFLALGFVEPVWALLDIAFAAASATPPFEAARAATIPEVVSEDGYGDALTLSNITFQVVLVLGYLFGGGLVAIVGPRTALVVNAGTFAVSGVLLGFMRAGKIARPGGTVSANLRAAARTIYEDRFLRRAAALATIGGAGGIVGEALVAVYVRENLEGTGDWAIGFLAAMVPVGTILASALVRRRGEHEDLLRTSAMVVLLGAVGGCIWFLIEPPNLWAAAAFFSIGITFAMVIPAYAVVGTRLPEEIRASAFGLMQGMLLGGQALASIAGGGLAVLVGSGPAAALALFPALGYSLFAFFVAPGGKLTMPRFGSNRRAASGTN